MDVLALLKTCKAQDIRLTVAEETLHCDAPTGALTADIRAAIAQHKPQLLALLATPTGETAAAAATAPACEHVAFPPSPGDGGVRQCQHCPHAWEVPTPAGVLHLWSEILHDEVYGADSLTQARALWAASQIAVYTLGELRCLRQLQRTDPDTFHDKLVVIHRLKREFGCHVDEVIIPQPQEQEI